MKKRPEDFKKAAQELKISRWTIHNCSMCGYPCGYIFRGDSVSYDCGCDCVAYTNIIQSSWEEVADFYNYTFILKVIEKMNKFWGFE